MTDNFYDDEDFESEEDNMTKTLQSSSQLMPIVEVPSDMDTSRTESEAVDTSRTDISARDRLVTQ